MSEFWAMGGYGAYVWAAYGVTALLLVLLLVWSVMGARARETELEQIRKLSRSERNRTPSATLSDARGGAAAERQDGLDSVGTNASSLVTGDLGTAGGTGRMGG